MTVSPSQWRRNEFEKGGGVPVRRKAPEFFWVVPLRFLALKVQLVVLVSAFVMIVSRPTV